MLPKLALAFIGSLTAAGTIPAQDQLRFPDSPLGKRAAAFWTMLHEDDETALRHFIDGHMVPRTDISVEERMDMLRRVRSRHGEAELEKIVATQSDSLAIFARSPGIGLIKFEILVDPEKENRIDTVMLDQASEDDLAEGPVETLAADELVPAVERYLEELVENDEFAGVVLIAKDGVPILEQACGLADRDAAAPNEIDTKFNLGSINKTFTKLAIGILADRGKLSLDDPLIQFLPDYPNREAARAITVKHLLTHTSGLGGFHGPEYFDADKNQIDRLENYLPLFASKPLAFDPGQGQEYSNAGYVVLGIIIEKASGESYYDFVRENIFKPIGMNDTDSFRKDENVANRAIGYTHMTPTGRASERAPNVEMLPIRGSSGGGGFSTAPDLLKYANAIEQGNFPIPESLNEIDPGLRGESSIAGGAPGINAVMSHGPSGYTIIVLSNYDPPIAERVHKKIRQWTGR